MSRLSRIVARLREGLLVAFPWEIGHLRFLWLTRVRRRGLRTHDAPHSATAELGYSRSFFGRYGADRRVRWTMYLLASIPDCPKDSLLVIGPRYEPELLMAGGLGWRSVTGLDTFSYSPRVDVGDMHDLRYGDESFGAVSCAWTLSYSARPALAATEMVRVLRPGGYLVVAVQKTAPGFREVLTEVPSGVERVQTLPRLDELFAGLRRVAGFEPEGEGHTVAAYRKPVHDVP